jgi:hypothetical protein
MEQEFERRRKALENAYFHKRDQELMAQMAERQAKAVRTAQLAEATGIQNQSLLDRLDDLQIRPETLGALLLVPLVEIAWADGKMHASQRQAVLSAAKQAGLHKNYDAHHLLESWLDAKPDPQLLPAWKQYVCCLSRRMSAQEMQALQDETMDRALFVAESAGSLFGFHRVTREERIKLDELSAMLNELAAVFNCPEAAIAAASRDPVQTNG